MVEVKEGVVVGVSSSEWAGHVGQKLLQNFIINFWQKSFIGEKGYENYNNRVKYFR